MKFKRMFALLMVTLGLFSLMTLTKAFAAEPVVLKLAHEAPPTTIKGRTIQMFADLAKKNSNDSLIINVFPAAQLMPGKEEVRAVMRGQIDIISPQTSYYSSLDPAFDIFFQPFVFNDVKHAMGYVTGPFGRRLLARLDKLGLHGLGMWHDGPGYMFLKGEPMRTLDDLKGKKIRTFPSAPLEDALRAVSAIPVSLAPGDVYMSIQSGVINGVLTTPTFGAPNRWYEVLKGMTRMMWYMGGYAVGINKASWDKLSKQHQDAITRAMSEAEKWNIGIFWSNLAECEKLMADNGVKIVDLSPDQLALFRSKVQGVYDKQPKEIKELIQILKTTKE